MEVIFIVNALSGDGLPVHGGGGCMTFGHEPSIDISRPIEAENSSTNVQSITE